MFSNMSYPAVSQKRTGNVPIPGTVASKGKIVSAYVESYCL